MVTRFTLVAAAVGLVLAGAAIGDAGAATAVKSVATKTTAVTKTTPAKATVIKATVIKGALRKTSRIHVGTPVVRHARIFKQVRVVKHLVLAHRAPLQVKVVKAAARPLPQKFAHRAVTKTIVR